MIDLLVTCDLKLRCSLAHSCPSSSHLPVYKMLVNRRSSDCGDFGCVVSPRVFLGLWPVKITRSVTIESWQTCVVKRQFRSYHPKFIYTFDDQKCMIRVSFHKNKICVTPNSAQFVFFFQVIIQDLLHVGLQPVVSHFSVPPLPASSYFHRGSAGFFGLIVLNFSVSRCQDFFSRTRLSAVLMTYSYRYRLIVLWLFYSGNATGPPANFFFNATVGKSGKFW